MISCLLYYICMHPSQVDPPSAVTASTVATPLLDPVQSVSRSFWCLSLGTNLYFAYN